MSRRILCGLGRSGLSKKLFLIVKPILNEKTNAQNNLEII